MFTASLKTKKSDPSYLCGTDFYFANSVFKSNGANLSLSVIEYPLLKCNLSEKWFSFLKMTSQECFHIQTEWVRFVPNGEMFVYFPTIWDSHVRQASYIWCLTNTNANCGLILHTATASEPVPRQTWSAIKMWNTNTVTDIVGFTTAKAVGFKIITYQQHKQNIQNTIIILASSTSDTSAPWLQNAIISAKWNLKSKQQWLSEDKTCNSQLESQHLILVRTPKST